MRNISIDDINAAILNGGAGSLLVRVELEPASGLDGIIPVVRANCALTETGKPSVALNKRYGEKEEFEPLTAESTEKLLEEAYTQAREKAGIVWNGQEFLVQGNPAVFDNASAEE